MTTLKLWFGEIATTIANFGALLVFAIIYAVLLFASYLFISIREATVWQVLLTYALMILIPLGFFTLQSSIINRVSDQKFRWRVILIDALKFLAVTIPALLLVWLLYYLLNKFAARYSGNGQRVALVLSFGRHAGCHLCDGSIRHHHLHVIRPSRGQQRGGEMQRGHVFQSAGQRCDHMYRHIDASSFCRPREMLHGRAL